MPDVIEFIQSSISAFDLIVFLIVVYSMAQCTAKGFTRSLLSFSKWLLALIITIILVPKLNPWVQDYIESKFIADIGLGVFIYIVSLFVIINIGKLLVERLLGQVLAQLIKPLVYFLEYLKDI